MKLGELAEGDAPVEFVAASAAGQSAAIEQSHHQAIGESRPAPLPDVA